MAGIFLLFSGGAHRRPVAGAAFDHTLIQTARTEKPGYLTGLWVISGHALLEMAIVGLAFMVEFEVTAANRPRLLAFFIGHEAGDRLCFLLISILACRGLSMIAFGPYLAVSLYFQSGKAI